MKKSLLIVSHGSRVEETKNTIFKVQESLRKRDIYEDVRVAFMEFNSPNIPDAIESIYNDGIRYIIVAPMFLFQGNHIKKDIPEVLKTIKQKHLDLKIYMAEPIGFDDRLVDIIAERAEGKLCKI